MDYAVFLIMKCIKVSWFSSACNATLSYPNSHNFFECPLLFPIKASWFLEFCGGFGCPAATEQSQAFLNIPGLFSASLSHAGCCWWFMNYSWIVHSGPCSHMHVLLCFVFLRDQLWSSGSLVVFSYIIVQSHPGSFYITKFFKAWPSVCVLTGIPEHILIVMISPWCIWIPLDVIGYLKCSWVTLRSHWILMIHKITVF